MIPHGWCINWNWYLLTLHVLSDAFIALAYFSIPTILVVLNRRHKIGHTLGRSVFYLFSAFILSCGLTHVMEIVVIWEPAYWLQGWTKCATAILSLWTAITMLVKFSQISDKPSVFELMEDSPDLSDDEVLQRMRKLAGKKIVAVKSMSVGAGQ